MFDQNFLNVLVCPACKAEVVLNNNYIVCTQCKRQYPIRNGIPIMLGTEAENNDVSEKRDGE
jgi:uncharacterized protein YbaR (Trm112 family)